MRKKRKVKLNLISPVHIGTGEKLKGGIDFVLYQGACYFVDMKRLTAELKRKGCIDEYVTEMRGREPNTIGLLKNHQIALQRIAKGYSSKLSHWAREIYPFIRNPLGEPYIPGSAIKGAIRTAVLWKMVKELRDSDPAGFQERVIREVEKTLNNSRMSPKKKREVPGAFLTPEFLQNYAPKRGDRDAHTDILRALEVGDALPVAPNSLEIKSVKMVSWGDEGDGRGWHFSHRKDRKTGKSLGDITVYVECMMPAEPLKLKIGIDEKILDDLKAQSETEVLPWCRSLGGIMDVCQEFTDFCIKQEEMGFYQRLKGVDKIKDFYEQERPNLRIGWGSGLAETTIISLLPPDIRQRVQGLFRGTSGPKFPKTRRAIIEDNQPTLPLGWVRLEVEG